MLCGCVSMAHPVRKLSRGICIGAAFWMAILTIITTLQVRARRYSPPLPPCVTHTSTHTLRCVNVLVD